MVAHSQVIAPYERTLNTMKVAERRAWGERVAAQLAEAVPDLSRVVFLAGKRYSEFLTQKKQFAVCLYIIRYADNQGNLGAISLFLL